MKGKQSSRKGTEKTIAAYVKKYAVLIVLAAILTNAAAYAFTHFEGPSEYGDDPNYLFLAYSVINGTYMVNPHYIFSLRLMSFLPITLIYLLLGVNGFTSSLWNIISYLGVIAVTFIIVKLLYNRKAALLSAFLISIYPLATKFAVNIGEDMPLTFIASLAVLFFVYAKKTGSRWYYLASGVFLVFTWLISYEGAVVILFVLLYALYSLYRKSIHIDRNTLFFIYGIVIPFVLVFIMSSISSGYPFAMITGNLGFYSSVGVLTSNTVTIPTTNDNLMFYVNGMGQYRVFKTLFASTNIVANFRNMANVLFFLPAPSSYGLYYYLVLPILALLLIFRDRRSIFFIAWFAVATLFLEFGPMAIHIVANPAGNFGASYNNIGYTIDLGPVSIVYVLAYRLLRFMLVAAVPMAAIIGIGFAKMLEVKNKYLLAFDIVVIAILLGVLFLNNYLIEHYWYYWQHYPESIVSQVGNYLRVHSGNSQIYLENILGEAYSSSTLPTYLGNPDTRRVDFNVNGSTPCSAFAPNSYAIWSTTATCPGWHLIYNVTAPTDIPSYIISGEISELPYLPKYIYYIG